LPGEAKETAEVPENKKKKDVIDLKKSREEMEKKAGEKKKEIEKKKVDT